MVGQPANLDARCMHRLKPPSKSPPVYPTHRERIIEAFMPNVSVYYELIPLFGQFGGTSLNRYHKFWRLQPGWNSAMSARGLLIFPIGGLGFMLCNA